MPSAFLAAPENVMQGVEQAGVFAPATGVIFQDVEQIVIEAAEAPDGDAKERDGAQVGWLEEQAADGDQAGEKKEQTFGVEKRFAADVVGEGHGSYTAHEADFLVQERLQELSS